MFMVIGTTIDKRVDEFIHYIAASGFVETSDGKKNQLTIDGRLVLATLFHGASPYFYDLCAEAKLDKPQPENDIDYMLDFVDAVKVAPRYGHLLETVKKTKEALFSIRQINEELLLGCLALYVRDTKDVLQQTGKYHPPIPLKA